MKIRLTIALLLMYGSFLTSFAEIPDIVGAWKGPDDLMINLCLDSAKNMYVCQCGIFRTFGWVNVKHEFRADSLLLKSNDYGSPFEGRFRIVSADRMIGTLKMGNIFLGGWSVNDEPQTQYGSSNSVAGTVYKTGQNTAIMIFPTENNRVEIYELRK